MAEKHEETFKINGENLVAKVKLDFITSKI